MNSDSPQDLSEIIQSHIYVQVELGVYGGWKESLLKEKLHDTELYTLLCGRCLGVVRDAFTYKIEDKTIEDKTIDSLRCKNCLPADINSIFPVTFVGKAIEQKLAVCPFADCGWQNPITELEKHLRECEELLVPCPLKCHSEEDGKIVFTLIKRAQVEEHCKSECPMLFERCDGCNLKFRVEKLEDHQQTCEFIQVPCPNRCKDQSENIITLRRNEIKLHTFRDCPCEKMKCPYFEEGCVEVVDRINLELHESDFMLKHLKLLTECLRRQSIESIQLKSRIDELETSTNNPIVGMSEMKIVDVSHKLEHKEETNSEPFFVGHYKFQLTIQWDCERNGDIGCYVSILKGYWDDSLTWPVRYKFRFIILSQQKKDDYVKTGEISENEMKDLCASFHKPQTEKNDGYGLKKFISCEECRRERHTLNDSLTIRAMIEMIPSRSNSIC